MNNTNLPSIEEFKQQAKELKASQNFEKLGHAQNALAKQYGYKNYRAIKSVLKNDNMLHSNNQPETITPSEFRDMISKQIFPNDNPTITFRKEHYFNNQKNIVDGIPIDPILPNNFWSTAHNNREKIEIDEWWGKPFILTEAYYEESYNEYYSRKISFYNEDKINYKIETEDQFNTRMKKEKKQWYDIWETGIRYDVYILDGGAWDRPTTKAKVGTLIEALEIAKNLLKS